MSERYIKRNHDRVLCLYLMLAIYPINNLICSLCAFVQITPPNILVILYVTVLIYGCGVILKYSFTRNDFLFLIIIYLGYFMLYLLSTDEAKIEMQSVYMIIVYMYFVPLSVIVLSHIENFAELFCKRYVIMSDLLVIMSIISKVLLNDQTDYMVFSYDLLPMWGIILFSAINYHKKKQWLIVIMILVEALIFGSRGALLWLLACGMLIYFIGLIKLKNLKQFMSKMIYLPLIAIIAVMAIIVIVPQLLQSRFADSSYILLRMSMGSLSESNARIELLQICFNELRNMGLNINGLYYDRTILPSGMYTHNIFIEVLLSFGWILGTLFLLFIFKKIFNAFKLQTYEGKAICAYFVSTLFFRYFISGSIFGEGKFIMFIAIIIALNKYTQAESGIQTELFNNRGVRYE